LDYEPAPVQDLPFGVGGGLVAIKTLLGRDPCVHANTAIEMIDAILKEHPAAQPAVQEKCFLCGERVDSCASDVCPKSAQPAVIQQMVDALDHADELLGGNDTLVMNGAAAGRWLLEQPAVQEGRDWSLLEATQESLREHMAEIKRLKAAQQAPVQEPTIEDNSQDWAGMDGATAWHLINRHADGWADVAKMMGEWLAANTPPATVPLTDEQIIEHFKNKVDTGSLLSFADGVRYAEAVRNITATPQPVPVKTYSGGKPWPVTPAPDPAPIIQQLVTALEGSGTHMRSDQWYIEIEAVAAGKFYLNSKGEGL
jgi:hypothetical protein